MYDEKANKKAQYTYSFGHYHGTLSLEDVGAGLPVLFPHVAHRCRGVVQRPRQRQAVLLGFEEPLVEH